MLLCISMSVLEDTLAQSLAQCVHVHVHACIVLAWNWKEEDGSVELMIVRRGGATTRLEVLWATKSETRKPQYYTAAQGLAATNDQFVSVYLPCRSWGYPRMRLAHMHSLVLCSIASCADVPVQAQLCSSRVHGAFQSEWHIHRIRAGA